MTGAQQIEAMLRAGIDAINPRTARSAEFAAGCLAAADFVARELEPANGDEVLLNRLEIANIVANILRLATDNRPDEAEQENER